MHGGALANLLWCRRGTAVLELALPEPQYRMYRHMAAALGMRYEALDELPEGSFASTVDVPLPRYEAALAVLLRELRPAAAQGAD